MSTYGFVIDKTIGGVLKPLIKNQVEGVVNISTATEILFRLKKPDGTIIERTGTTYTDGTDGYAKYVLVENDLDQSGIWKYWIRITAPSFTLSTWVQKAFKVRGG